MSFMAPSMKKHCKVLIRMFLFLHSSYNVYSIYKVVGARMILEKPKSFKLTSDFMINVEVKLCKVNLS